MACGESEDVTISCISRGNEAGGRLFSDTTGISNPGRDSMEIVSASFVCLRLYEVVFLYLKRALVSKILSVLLEHREFSELEGCGQLTELSLSVFIGSGS